MKERQLKKRNKEQIPKMKQRTITKNEAKKIRSDNFTRSN